MDLGHCPILGHREATGPSTLAGANPHEQTLTSTLAEIKLRRRFGTEPNV